MQAAGGLLALAAAGVPSPAAAVEPAKRTIR